jgi:hypothetical protein
MANYKVISGSIETAGNKYSAGDIIDVVIPEDEIKRLIESGIIQEAKGIEDNEPFIENQKSETIEPEAVENKPKKGKK